MGQDEWKRLDELGRQMAGAQLQDLFDAEPDRASRLSVEFDGLLLDFSRNFITEETLACLERLCRQAGLAGEIERLFSGGEVNPTEQRPALHTALRGEAPDATIRAEVDGELGHMADFVDALARGEWTGATDRPIRDVVNLGIGGSHLGPELLIDALDDGATEAPRVHFQASTDPASIRRLLGKLDPETTLFIIASKSFSTRETMLNAEAARAWLREGMPARDEEALLARHAVAVTAREDRARSLGLPDGNIFRIWDWVGGRYSVWSAIGLPVAIRLGMDAFRRLLGGAHRADELFRTAPFRENIPMLLALLDIWYAEAFGAQSRAVLPYRDGLRLLPAYLQQLEMESNGKRTRVDGRPVGHDTAPVVWGNMGLEGQHAFFQLLHQGTRFIPLEFIAVIEDGDGDSARNDFLLASCIAQTEALMGGRGAEAARARLREDGLPPDEVEALVPHKTFPGNRPSTVWLLDRLDPETMGMLLAFYEHKVFVQAVLWGINPFDQMGVELGKEMTGEVADAFDSEEAAAERDPAASRLIDRVRRHRHPRSS